MILRDDTAGNAGEKFCGKKKKGEKKASSDTGNFPIVVHEELKEDRESWEKGGARSMYFLGAELGDRVITGQKDAYIEGVMVKNP